MGKFLKAFFPFSIKIWRFQNKVLLNKSISFSFQQGYIVFNANEVLFTLSAENKYQVDSWAKTVEKAGGKIISKPEEFGKGHYGFVFADPDGHKFNVFYM